MGFQGCLKLIKLLPEQLTLFGDSGGQFYKMQVSSSRGSGYKINFHFSDEKFNRQFLHIVVMLKSVVLQTKEQHTKNTTVDKIKRKNIYLIISVIFQVWMISKAIINVCFNWQKQIHVHLITDKNSTYFRQYTYIKSRVHKIL